MLALFNKEQVSLNFLLFLNNKQPNIKFKIETQINHSIAFLDVFLSSINSQNLTLLTYQKPTYTRLLLNFNPIQGGDDQKSSPTSFSTVNSTNVGIGPKNVLIFSFNPFSTLV